MKPEKRIVEPLLLLTGTTGAGKSTVCLRLAALCREQGHTPAGIVTQSDGPRRYLLDLASGEQQLLAADGEALAGPRWGRFSFCQEALDWGNEAVRRAVEGPADLVLLDEVGPLELIAGAGFLPALERLLGSEKAGLIVVRPALLESLRTLARGRPAEVYEVTGESRDALPALIAALVE